MFVQSLQLVTFRNYADADLRLQSGHTVLVGRNGQGKTNLVEAIGYLSALASHRTTQDSALVMKDRDSAIIRAVVEHDGRRVSMEFQLNAVGANKAQINGNSVRPLELTRYLNTVIFAPEDLAIVRGDPGIRRRFIDALIVKRQPRLAGVLTDYERTLKQRNSLLKSARTHRNAQLSTLDVWNERLVTLGTEIIVERFAMVDRLQPWLESSYRDIVSDDHRPQLSYESQVFRDEQPVLPEPDEVRQRFETQLDAVRRDEVDRGITLVGPHRDDLLWELNGLPAKGYASHGETWSLVLAAKLATVELLRQVSAGGDPVVILDDVFAELDVGRREALAASLSSIEQVLITAAILDDVPEILRDSRIGIAAGVITPVGLAESDTL